DFAFRLIDVCLWRRGPSRIPEAAGEQLGGDSFPAGRASEPPRNSRPDLAEGLPGCPGSRRVERLVGASEASAGPLTAKVKDAATTASIQALVMVKLHYP